jgi:succinyl-CoA synthetase beta subunit
VPALVQAILRVRDLVDLVGDDVEEIEINPLIVHDEGSGVSAVDFMLRASTRK